MVKIFTLLFSKTSEALEDSLNQYITNCTNCSHSDSEDSGKDDAGYNEGIEDRIPDDDEDDKGDTYTDNNGGEPIYGGNGGASITNHPQPPIYDLPRRRVSTITFQIPASQPSFPNYNNHQNYPRNNIDMSSSYIKDRQYQQLTAKMNILLIAGIAAGIVVLLFILVLAACKFYTSSAGVAGAKAINDYQRTATKTPYAYEACNTGAKCSSPLLMPTSQQTLPHLNSNSQAGLTNVASSTPNTATKPAKKDVKEWYV